MKESRYELVSVEVGIFGLLTMYRCKDCGSMVAGTPKWAGIHDTFHDKIDRAASNASMLDVIG